MKTYAIDDFRLDSLAFVYDLELGAAPVMRVVLGSVHRDDVVTVRTQACQRLRLYVSHKRAPTR